MKDTLEKFSERSNDFGSIALILDAYEKVNPWANLAFHNK